MKKICAVLILAGCLTLTACGGKNNNTDPKEANSPNPVAEDVSTQPEGNKDETKPGAFPSVSKAEENAGDETLAEEVKPERAEPIYAYIYTGQKDFEGSVSPCYSGLFRREYFIMSDEAYEKCPELCKALEDFDAKREQEAADTREQFKETAEGYAEMMAGIVGDTYFDPCIDYEDLIVTRSDSKVFSFATRESAYWGGAQDFEIVKGYTFDSETGKQLTFDDVVKDPKAFEDAVEEELLYRFGMDFFTGDIDVSGLTWCWGLTPDGIVVYYNEGELQAHYRKAIALYMSYSKYSDILNEEYNCGVEEYAIPFDSINTFSWDIDGDGASENLEFIPDGPEEAAQGEEYATFKIRLNGEDYTDMPEFWFFANEPFFVHKKDGNYIYLYEESYEKNPFYIIKISEKGAEFVEEKDGTPYNRTSVDDREGVDFSYVRIAITDPKIIDEQLYR